MDFLLLECMMLNSFRCVSSADVKNFFMPKVAPRTDAQSNLLTKKDVNHLYKIQCKFRCALKFLIAVY